MQFGTKTLRAGICPTDVTAATRALDRKTPPGCKPKYLCQQYDGHGIEADAAATQHGDLS